MTNTHLHFVCLLCRNFFKFALWFLIFKTHTFSMLLSLFCFSRECRLPEHCGGAERKRWVRLCKPILIFITTPITTMVILILLTSIVHPSPWNGWSISAFVSRKRLFRCPLSSCQSPDLLSFQRSAGQTFEEFCYFPKIIQWLLLYVHDTEVFR